MRLELLTIRAPDLHWYRAFCVRKASERADPQSSHEDPHLMICERQYVHVRAFSIDLIIADHGDRGGG